MSIMHLDHAPWCDRSHAEAPGSVFRGCLAQLGTQVQVERRRPGAEPTVVLEGRSVDAGSAARIASAFEEFVTASPDVQSDDLAALGCLAGDLRRAAALAHATPGH